MTKAELLLFYNEVKPYLHLHVSTDGSRCFIYFENGLNKTYIEVSQEVFDAIINEREND